MNGIIIITSAYPPDVGGVAQQTMRIANYIKKSQLKSLVMCIKDDEIGSFYDGDHRIFKPDNVVTSLGRHGELNCAWRAILPAAFSASSVLSLSLGRPAYWGDKLAEQLRVPHFMIAIGSDLNELFQRFVKKWRLAKLVSRAKKIGILSPDMKPTLEQLGCLANKIVLLPPGFDSESFIPMNVKIETDFLFVGRAKRAKGLDVFLKSLARIKIPCKVRLIVPEVKGDKEFFEECLCIANKIDSFHEIEWLPQQTKNELAHHYNSCRFVVVPSRCEGSPHVVLEAMACETPVIASRVGRIEYFIGSDETLFKSEEELASLIMAAKQGKIQRKVGMRERVLSITGIDNESCAYLEFLEIAKT